MNYRRSQVARLRQPPPRGAQAAGQAGRTEAGSSDRWTNSPTAVAEQQPAGSLIDQLNLDLRLLTKALTIRRTEEKLLDLFSQGRLTGTVHTCIGQEWIGVAVAEALKSGDTIFSNHRGHGHYLAWTDDLEGLIAEIMGTSAGVCGGRGGSQHLCKDGFYSNGIQGGIAAPAAGLALAHRLRGGSNIAVVYLGDGTLGEGAVYETLNIAAKWSLPLLIVVEDNGVSQSTDQQETLAGTIKGRAHAFGIDTHFADTWHPSALIAETQKAVRRIRQKRIPMLLQVKTYRLKAHSKGDDQRKRSIVRKYAEADILNQILAADLDPINELVSSIDERIEHAVALADAATDTTIETHSLDRPTTEKTSTSISWQAAKFEPMRVVDAIRTAFDEAMDADSRIMLIGEDLCDPYGGAFKVTAGLSSKYGMRVRNAPISEAAIAGIGNGLALAGYKPVIEIMFGDFALLAADQFVNHAAKFAWMYNDKVNVPVILRMPSGGYRGYGPTHSQSLEKHLLGVPGTRVLALHPRYCPHQLYRDLLATNDQPTIVVENKQMYGQSTRPEPPVGLRLERTNDLFPTVRLRPEGPRQLTIVAYGGMATLAEAALDVLNDEDIACDLILPTQLFPFDLEPVVESVQQTHRLLVVEEGQGFAGFGSEVLARIGSDPRISHAAMDRVSASCCPIPASKAAEAGVLPSASGIVTSALSLIARS